MVFSSTIFLFVFLPILLIAYFNPIFKSRRTKNGVLLAGSLIFYAWGEPVFVFVMILTIIVNWAIGLKMERPGVNVKAWEAVAIVIDVAILVVFKYLTFITRNIALLTGNDSVIVKIALPIGISFFTFQMMSYIFDIANGKATAQKNLFDVMLYITMFPQLIAGPIVRYDTIAEEINGRKESFSDFSEGSLRFVKGLAKKVLLANNLAILADTVFDGKPEEMAALTAWLGAVAYTLQLYFDFSGYSDMAIGLGRIFGFHFPENFDRPYASKSISEYWRKWHISMGSWFRDYVYFPMGGSRVGSVGRYIFNLLIVWLLTGLWHGADWTYVVWGLLNFLFLLFEKKVGLDKNQAKWGHLYYWFLLIISLVTFRSATLKNALSYYQSMFGLQGNAFVDADFTGLFGQFWILILIALILSVIKVKPAEKTGAKIVAGFFYSFVFLVTVTYIVKGGYNPFIYFNF